MATPAQPNVNEPRQRRSRETRDRLLQATRELLEERTFEDLTIQQIATRAGCSVGAFYGRFEGKEAILPQLLQMHYAEVEREVSAAFRPEAWVGAPLERRVDAVVDHLLSVAQRQPGLIRTLVLRNYQRPETIPASIRSAARRVLARVYAVLLGGRPRTAHPAGTTAVEVGLLMVVAAIRERVILTGATHSSTLTASTDVLAEELKRALLAYLTLTRK